MSAITPLLPYLFKYGYFGIFVIMYAGAVILPLPANLTLVGAGVLSHVTINGTHFNIFLAALIGFTANVLGDITGYWIARRFGKEERYERFAKKHPTFRTLEKYLKAHPVITVGATRLIGFASPWVNTLAGFSKLSFMEFLGSDMLGNGVYIILYVGAGYLLGSAVGNTLTLIGIGTGLLAVILGIYVGALVVLRSK